MVNLSSVIAPSFFPVHKSIKNNEYTHYWLKGGRGSTKSSFASLEIIYGMMKNADTNAVVVRKVKETNRDSTYEKLLWAIEMLGVSAFWEYRVSPLSIIYRPTGQKIFFRGLQDPLKIKEITVKKGYIKYIWYEGLDEFYGADEIRIANQSFVRGGDDFTILYTYNPPKSNQSWVNAEINVPNATRLIHHSTYKDVSVKWLGKTFIIEAEHLEKTKPEKYEHEYLGTVTGTGGEVFTNLTIREITNDEIKQFDRIYHGIDWGYASDPFDFGSMHYDKTRRKLYLYVEVQELKLSNRLAYERIKGLLTQREIVTADSAEPKSIAELKDYGLNIKGAKKGKDSINVGMKWLEDLEEIIIDPIRCPNTTREFTRYELDRDKNGNFIAKYPDRNNHSIDRTRYAMESEIMRTKKLPPLRINIE